MAAEAGVMMTTGGALGSVTVTETSAVAVPPGPVAVMVYVVASVGDTWTDPLAPTDPMSGSITQASALVEFQVRVDDSPDWIFSGLALMLTVGKGILTDMLTVFVVVPPGPTAVSV